MQQDNYVTIVKNSLNSINYKNDVNYKDVVLAFKKTIDENKDLILTTNNIDITNETGKKINFNLGFSDFFYYVSLCYEIMGQNEKLYTKKKKYV